MGLRSLEKNLYDWASALRLTGNKAAHEVEEHIDAEDARDVLDFTEALAEYLYTLRGKYEEFVKRNKP